MGRIYIACSCSCANASPSAVAADGDGRAPGLGIKLKSNVDQAEVSHSDACSNTVHGSPLSRSGIPTKQAASTSLIATQALASLARVQVTMQACK